MPSIEIEFARLMAEADVPGAAAAVIRDGQIDQYVKCGTRGVQTPDLVDEHTVFEAASLSKPVFAHAVLQLADQGRLSLQAPLGDYLPNYLPGDPRASSVTASDVLSHCAGLPNWRSPDFPLRTYFQRRDRFSYSGEGYLYLQKAVEAVTGEKMHAIADRLVFEPFAMTRSSFVWHARLDENRAYRS
jgi:CubicO group peptidase (beta-lactamase class C family)